MTDKKQIEEMAKDVAKSISWCKEEYATVDCLGTAATLYGKGYRKQSEGEWEHINGNEHICKSCSMTFYGFVDDFNFCPNCGAKMKGADNDRAD